MKRLLVGGCVAVLLGCGVSAPKCGDDETIALVKQVLLESLSNAGYDENVGLVLEVGAVRTSNHDEATGKQSCAAELTISANNVNTGERTSAKKELRYTSELTSKTGEFYVSVEDI